MSHSSLRKKLQPAKKIWKRLSKTVESKLHKFNFSKAITAIKNSSSRILSYCSLHFLHIFKKRSITRKPPYYFDHHYNFYSSSKKQLTYKNQNFSPIYIDQLYSVEAAAGSSSSSLVQAKKVVSCAETSSSGGGRGKQVADEKVFARKEDKAKAKAKEKEKVLYSIEDAWREVVAKSPQLRPVDDRAEEFISRFHQDIQVQKEKSSLEFQQMLARGA